MKIYRLNFSGLNFLNHIPSWCTAVVTDLTTFVSLVSRRGGKKNVDEIVFLYLLRRPPLNSQSRSC